MNNYFNYHPIYKWFSKKWFENIKDFFRWIKYSWQRAFRGYADCDVWDMCGYLNAVIIPMLKTLRESDISYPYDFNSIEEWHSTLDKMIIGFEAGSRYSDFNYEGTPEEVKKLFNDDIKVSDESLKLFTKYYYYLWD